MKFSDLKQFILNEVARLKFPEMDSLQVNKEEEKLIHRDRITPEVSNLSPDDFHEITKRTRIHSKTTDNVRENKPLVGDGIKQKHALWNLYKNSKAHIQTPGNEPITLFHGMRGEPKTSRIKGEDYVELGNHAALSLSTRYSVALSNTRKKSWETEEKDSHHVLAVKYDPSKTRETGVAGVSIKSHTMTPNEHEIITPPSLIKITGSDYIGDHPNTGKPVFLYKGEFVGSKPSHYNGEKQDEAKEGKTMYRFNKLSNSWNLRKDEE